MLLTSLLVEEAEDLACHMLSSSLFVIHYARRSREDDIAELTGRQKLNDPLLEVCYPYVVSRRDDTGLVETVNGG